MELWWLAERESKMGFCSRCWPGAAATARKWVWGMLPSAPSSQSCEKWQEVRSRWTSASSTHENQGLETSGNASNTVGPSLEHTWYTDRTGGMEKSNATITIWTSRLPVRWPSFVLGERDMCKRSVWVEPPCLLFFFPICLSFTFLSSLFTFFFFGKALENFSHLKLIPLPNTTCKLCLSIHSRMKLGCATEL